VVTRVFFACTGTLGQVIDGPLMEELAAIKSAVVPDEVLLVVDAMTGQEAATLTERFNRWASIVV